MSWKWALLKPRPREGAAAAEMTNIDHKYTEREGVYTLLHLCVYVLDFKGMPPEMKQPSGGFHPHSCGWNGYSHNFGFLNICSRIFIFLFMNTQRTSGRLNCGRDMTEPQPNQNVAQLPVGRINGYRSRQVETWTERDTSVQVLAAAQLTALSRARGSKVHQQSIKSNLVTNV